jgi:threonine dehydrogenase-like Zn-dependent dehydrogenase
MGETCRAAVFSGKGSYEVREFPMPAPPPGGAVLAVEAVGMCGSDVMQFHGDRHVPGEVAPVVPGHEIVGRIADISPEAARAWGVSEGDRVCVDEIVRCGRCRGCSAGGLCHFMQLYGYTKGPDDDGGLWGGYGEYLRLLPETHVMRAPDGLSAEQLTIFEPLANAVNWMQGVGVAWGETVVVQGPGHQGLLCAVVASAFGASRVIVTGTSQDALRLQTASRLGAFATIVVDEQDVTARVAELTGGQMADVVLDVSPVPQTAATAIDLVSFGGRVGYAGLKHFEPVSKFFTDPLVLKNVTVRGCAGSTPASMETAVKLLGERPDIAQTMAGTAVTLDTLEHGLDLLERHVDGEDAVHVTLVHAQRG